MVAHSREVLWLHRAEGFAVAIRLVDSHPERHLLEMILTLNFNLTLWDYHNQEVPP